MADPAGNNQNLPPSERGHIAEWVTGFTLAGIFLISAFVLYVCRGNPEMIRYVFASIIPLLGSWMGTILAFYFSRDSLAAATQSVRDLTQAVTGDRLKTVPVKEK